MDPINDSTSKKAKTFSDVIGDVPKNVAKLEETSKKATDTYKEVKKAYDLGKPVTDAICDSDPLNSLFPTMYPFGGLLSYCLNCFFCDNKEPKEALNKKQE